MTWLIKGEFQWLSFAVLFLISFFLTRYGSECLGLGDVLLLLSWSGGLTLNQLMQLLFLASLLGLLFFFIFSLTIKNLKEYLLCLFECRTFSPSCVVI